MKFKFDYIPAIISAFFLTSLISIFWYFGHKESTKKEISRESVGMFITAEQTPGGWGTDEKTLIKTDKGVFVISGHSFSGMKDQECFIIRYDFGASQFLVGKFSYRLK